MRADSRRAGPEVSAKKNEIASGDVSPAFAAPLGRTAKDHSAPQTMDLAPSDIRPDFADNASFFAAVDESAHDVDRALLIRWSAGDQAAGQELLSRYRTFFHKSCLRFGLRDEDLMIECLQEVVLGLVSDLAGLADRVATSFGGFLAWRLRDAISRRRRAHVAPQPLPDGLADGRADPADAAALRDALQRCAAKLPPQENRVFEMRFVAGLSVQETAAELRRSANAVSQSLFRASRKLRACLEAAGFTA